MWVDFYVDVVVDYDEVVGYVFDFVEVGDGYGDFVVLFYFEFGEVEGGCY